MTAIRMKRDRTRRSGFRGSLNAQDFPREPYNPARLMHDAARVALAMIRGHAKRAGWLGEPVVMRAVDSLSELAEWTKERDDA